MDENDELAEGTFEDEIPGADFPAEDAAEDIPVEETEFIQKPFNTDRLAIRLRNVLDRR